MEVVVIADPPIGGLGIATGGGVSMPVLLGGVPGGPIIMDCEPGREGID